MAELELPTQIQPLAISLSSRQLQSNFFATPVPRSSFSVYSVEFTPAVDYENRQLRGSLVRKCEPTIESRLGKFVLSGINLFSIEIPGGPQELEISVPEEQHQLTLRKVRTVMLGSSLGNKDAQQVLNILFKRAMRALGLLQLTRLPKFYDPRRVDEIPEFRLTVWKGFTLEVNVYDQRPFACIDFASKVIHKESVLDVIREIRNARGTEALSQELCGRIVLTNYGNHRCYHIDEVDLSKRPTDVFFNDKLKQEVSFRDYFRSQYQKDITDLTQPLLKNTNRKTGKVVYIVPELVSLTGLDDEMRSRRGMMQTLAKSTRLSPNDRYSQSTRLAGRLTEPSAQSVLSPFQVSISSTPHTVSYYSLPAVKVYTDKRENAVTVGDRGDFRPQYPIKQPVSMRDWVVISDDWDRAESAVSELRESLRRLGCEVDRPERKDYVREVDRLFQDLAARTRPPQIAVLLLSGRQRSQYGNVKRISISQFPIVTQWVSLPINDRNRRSIIEKVALQIQAKVGARLWCTEGVNSFNEYTMVVGIDTFHDIVNRQQSVVGFCATIDAYMSQYFSTASFQPTGQEIGTSIGAMMREALAAFKGKWSKYPKNIVVFRDGVADSQVPAVTEMEVKPLAAVLAAIADYHPFVTYTLVVKKTSAKFYSQSGSNISNPRPGTFITEVVPSNGDFYLIAHSPFQGIATPVLYRTVYTTQPSNYPLMDLATLAYRLCHMYANWTGAVKVPAPCMMAHKLAYMLGQHVHAQSALSLKQFSYYL